jgi:cytochrome c oxidase subunit 1
LRYAALIGGILSVVIRGELQEPGLQIFANTHTYNLFVTSHGLVMIFFALMPALIGGFGNQMVPLRILVGMPRRIADYADAFAGMSEISSLGAYFPPSD